MSIRSWLALGVLVALLGSGGLIRVPVDAPDGELTSLVESNTTSPPDSSAGPTSVEPTLTPPPVRVPTPWFGHGGSPYDLGTGSSGTTYSPSTVMPDISPRIPPTGFGGPVVGSGGGGLRIPR